MGVSGATGAFGAVDTSGAVAAHAALYSTSRIPDACQIIEAIVRHVSARRAKISMQNSHKFQKHSAVVGYTLGLGNFLKRIAHKNAQRNTQ